MDNKIHIKGLSVNKCWQGRRFKTKEYQAYEQELLYLLPKIEIPRGGMELNLIFGFSSKASDIDNPIKPLLDVLQKKYKFNDKMIYKMTVEKQDVKKGEEFIYFDLSTKNPQ